MPSRSSTEGTLEKTSYLPSMQAGRLLVTLPSSHNGLLALSLDPSSMEPGCLAAYMNSLALPP